MLYILRMLNPQFPKRCPSGVTRRMLCEGFRRQIAFGRKRMTLKTEIVIDRRWPALYLTY
jgi:hypothetical protein